MSNEYDITEKNDIASVGSVQIEKAVDAASGIFSTVRYYN
jgi:hypothetical protein